MLRFSSTVAVAANIQLTYFIGGIMFELLKQMYQLQHLRIPPEEILT